MTADSETTSKAPLRHWPYPSEGSLALSETFRERHLSSADHTDVLGATGDLGDAHESAAPRLSPPPRVDALHVTLADALIRGGRRSGVACAAGAGTGRMRRVMNKMVSEADMLRTAATAFNNVWRYLKLCFTIGLATAQDPPESLQGELDLVEARVTANRDPSAAPETGVDVARHTTRGSGEDMVLPGDFLSTGLENDRPWKDRSETLVGSELEDCRWTPRHGTRPGLGLQHQTGHLPSYARPG